MKKTVFFKNGTYTKPCEVFPKNVIGGIHCTGHEKLNIKPCIFFESSEENDKYYLPILKEEIKIVSAVECSAPTQIKLF